MICKRCHNNRRHKARGLCRPCYATLSRGGGFADYPRTRWREDVEVGYCDCRTPDRTVVKGECDLCRRRYFSPEEIEAWRERLAT